jgi:hypothetical protein
VVEALGHTGTLLRPVCPRLSGAPSPIRDPWRVPFPR